MKLITTLSFSSDRNPRGHSPSERSAGQDPAHLFLQYRPCGYFPRL